MLTRLNIPSEFRGGFRVTSPEAMEVVRMVLVGQVGRDLVGLINRFSTLAVGMSGEDGGLFTATRRGALVDGEEVDLGLVGDVTTGTDRGRPGLIDAGRVPVVASIAPDLGGVVHNVNADTAAAARSASPCRPSGWLCSPTSRASTGTGPTAPTRSPSCRPASCGP